MIEQHPDESTKAFHAYECYQSLGAGRSIALAYAKYRQHDHDTVAKISGSFIEWKNRFNWDERVKICDASEAAAARERQRAIDDEAYQEELEQFRRLQLSAGKQGVAIALNLKTKLLKWVETHPTITTWTDAVAVSLILSRLEIVAAEQWAKALHIDRLLEQMLDDSEIDC